jgi:hypothetical protein
MLELAIGQHMAERLWASGLLSSVEVELEAESLMLVLVSAQGRVLSERVMRFCIDFQGSKQQEGRRNVFGWCSSNIEEISDQRCCIRVSGLLPAEFDMITEVILLGLRLSRFLPPSSVFYESSNLLRVYQTREDVLAFYEHFVAQVIQAGDDRLGHPCNVSLRDLWLCCEKHRFLFVQRLMLNDWLDFFLSASDTEDHNVFLHPSEGELKQRLAHLLARELTPQEWLKARAEYAAKSEEHGWDQRPRECKRSHYAYWACCSFHRAMMALTFLFSNWLEHFDTVYHVAEMKDQSGFAPDLMGPAGIALLVKQARLDTRTIPQTEWFEAVCAVNTDEFH